MTTDPGSRPLRVVVTGAGGFAGRHLLRRLESVGARGIAAPVRLPDRDGFARLLREETPQAVVHLAALSFLPDAERDPSAAWRANVDGTVSVLEALREADPGGAVRLVFASSGHVYRTAGGKSDSGGPPPRMPLDEDTALDPQGAYGRTKLAAEAACRLFGDAQRRPTVIFRAFNHTGPGQKPLFAAPNFARQVALIEAGRAEPVLWTGNLGSRRDFTDVRDIVRAYALAAAGEVPPGTYNLASGRAASLADIAAHFRSRSRASFEVRAKPGVVREGEAAEIRGSADRIAAAAGWRPEIPLAQTLDDVLADWRARVAEGRVEG